MSVQRSTTTAPTAEGTAATATTPRPKPRAGSPQSDAPPADAAEATESEEGEGEEDEPRSSLGWLRAMPSWLVSAVMHLVALLVAAFLTIELPDKQKRERLIVEAAEPEEEIQELVAEIEMDLEDVDVLDHSPNPTSMIDPGMMNFGDPTDDVPELSDEGVYEVSNMDVDEIGSLFGRNGMGMASIGDGMGGAAFFGTVSSGRRFVYVIDNSNSMTRGKFETALNELVRSVGSMSSTSSFYVIFFSDTAYGLFHPYPAPGFVKATEENKAKLKNWLRTVQLCLRTDGKEAMDMAFKMRPDAVYILGDGAFTDNTTKLLTAPHKRTVPIHTFGMDLAGKGEWQLKDIAKANEGKYTPVGVHPIAVQMAKKTPVPRNNSRGPVWGVKLPVGAKKKPAGGGPKKGPGNRKKP